MTEPKTTGVWSHLRKRFPAVNKCRQLWPDKITSHQDLVPSTMDLYIYRHLTFLEQTSSISNSGKPSKKATKVNRKPKLLRSSSYTKVIYTR